MSGIQKAAGLVGKIAPVVSQVAGMIPTPFSQGISAMANLVGGVANQVAPGQQPAAAAGPSLQAVGGAPAAGAPPGGLQPGQQVPAGAAPPAQQGPVM